MFLEKDIEQFKQKGISEEVVDWQISRFVKGVVPIDLNRAATVNDGILKVDKPEEFIEIYNNSDVKVTKFVPASGAASRMFKALFEFLEKSKSFGNEQELVERDSFIRTFFEGLKKFAFYQELEAEYEAEGGIDILLEKGKYSAIIRKLLEVPGLGYGQLPKGLLSFHSYPDGPHTPFEEHLTEGALYAQSKNQEAHIHFTVSPEHIAGFKSILKTVQKNYSEKLGVKFRIDLSVQKSSTDTLAVDESNNPFRQKDGSILFRPGGHGALIENLNEIESDLVFIKNIDNVVPEQLMEPTTKNKKLLAGILLKVRKEVFAYLQQLESGDEHLDYEEVFQFIDNNLFVRMPESLKSADRTSQRKAIIDRLNRPIRVCGVVKNEGEPGGGPYWVNDSEGSVSLQIVESSQIDMDNLKQESIFNQATHFNPVDLVCGILDQRGEKFDLKRFVDAETCFISHKSKDGQSLKALELPGLWNGAMAGWNTLFVEVPVETFNPVKTVNDLLRPQHQSL